jgi:hypothetical protein
MTAMRRVPRLTLPDDKSRDYFIDAGTRSVSGLTHVAAGYYQHRKYMALSSRSPFPTSSKGLYGVAANRECRPRIQSTQQSSWPEENLFERGPSKTFIGSHATGRSHDPQASYRMSNHWVNRPLSDNRYRCTAKRCLLL